jgi:hypothetical protein
VEELPPRTGTFRQIGTLGDLIDRLLPALLGLFHRLQRGIPSFGYLRRDVIWIPLFHDIPHGLARTCQRFRRLEFGNRLSRGLSDRGVRYAGRRPVLAGQGTMAERAGPPPLAQCRVEGPGELARQPFGVFAVLFQAFNSPAPVRSRCQYPVGYRKTVFGMRHDDVAMLTPKRKEQPYCRGVELGSVRFTRRTMCEEK